MRKLFRIARRLSAHNPDMPVPEIDNPGWLPALRRYFACMAGGNLLWEIVQLPLYTLRDTGTLAQQAFAIAHCTAGDLLIAAVAMMLALLVAGDARWPAAGFARVACVAVCAGAGYTVYSEWLNVVVRHNWAYSAAMPVVPLVGVGLSPLLQWVIIPAAALWCAKRA